VQGGSYVNFSVLPSSLTHHCDVERVRAKQWDHYRPWISVSCFREGARSSRFAAYVANGGCLNAAMAGRGVS
jgi:hypothetical protein